VAPCLGALGDHDLGAHVDRSAGVIDRLDLADQRHARLFDPQGERLRVTERKKHRRRQAFERELEEVRLLRQRPGDEAAADARVARHRDLLSEPDFVPVPATDQPEAAGD
jgi:hypothetical protein